MWPDATETQTMLEHAARDDPSAIDRLLACHREPLRRMIAVRLDRSVGRREDASDVVQSVLLEASRRLADYLRNPVMPFQLWLRQIARDRLNDVHRRHRVAARRSIDRERPIAAKEFLDRSSLDLAAELRDRGATPAAEAIRRELAERFHAALQELGEDDREILLLAALRALDEWGDCPGAGPERAGRRHALPARPAAAPRRPGHATESGRVTMDSAPFEAKGATKDDQLASLLAEMTAELQQGRVPDIDAVVRQHPELGEELRGLWLTAQVAEELARSAEKDAARTFPPAAHHGADEPPEGPAPLARIGDCELLEELGRGGMGVVYRARQLGLGRIVALKILLHAATASPLDVARFRAEASSAAQLDHPHIVPVYAVGDHEGQPYFLMRLIEGMSLARRLADGPMPAPRSGSASGADLPRGRLRASTGHPPSRPQALEHLDRP